MTNREKYAKEILDIVCEGSDVAVKNGVPCACENIECRECDLSGGYSCNAKFAKWYNSEYIEPPVDWSKVPVDTPIWARDAEDKKWVKRHFAGYKDGKLYAFLDGNTSWSNDNNKAICRCRLNFAKLTTDDELNANSILRADGRKEE